MSTKININKRLITALSLVDKCRCMADIGSDHGYGSIYAIENGIADRVIATDISAPSLAKTGKLVEESGLGDKIVCRVGDGLKPLCPGEADVAFIAGMGADLIAEIMEASPDVADTLSYAVLQPMNNAEPLRRKLVKIGFKIDKEALVIDNGKFYQIIRCSKGESQLSELQYELGAFVYNERIPLASEYIGHIMAKYENILNYIGENSTETANARLEEAKQKLSEYGEALKWAMQK